MSFSRGRLFFDGDAERGKEKPKSKTLPPQTLNFDDSDMDDGDFDGISFNCSGDGLPFSSFTETPPVQDDVKSFWDSGLGSPTPSSQLGRPVPREMCSPIPFDCSDEGSSPSGSGQELEPIPPMPPSPKTFKPALTPPHKKFRSLRIYDTPLTPKSLLQKAQRRVTSANRSTLKKTPLDKSVLLDPTGPQANVNPFTAERPSHGVKRCRNLLENSMNEDSFDEECDGPSSKKLALREINTSRYVEEFHEVSKLGDGEFGSVYKCINRLDGCTYAIKKSKTPVAGSTYERSALNEVYAHAVLGKHQHVVRYYSAWAEDNYMYIQNEFCNGGSLADSLAENYKTSQHLSEKELKQLLLQIAQGLKYIHSQSLVHLDVKPGNIFVHQNPKGSSSESGLEEDINEEEEEAEKVTYKIGDLGHVTAVTSPRVEEGDCRYLPNEILQERFDQLPKADIFSLALTIYEAGGGGVLPKNGESWHAIRRGELPMLEGISPDFYNLLKSMVHPDPVARPSAAALAHHPVLCPFAKKSRAQLRKELNQEKFKNELLSRQLEEAKKDGPPTVKVGNKKPRLIGKNFHRSMSSTVF